MKNLCRKPKWADENSVERLNLNTISDDWFRKNLNIMCIRKLRGKRSIAKWKIMHVVDDVDNNAENDDGETTCCVLQTRISLIPSTFQPVFGVVCAVWLLSQPNPTTMIMLMTKRRQKTRNKFIRNIFQIRSEFSLFFVIFIFFNHHRCHRRGKNSSTEVDLQQLYYVALKKAKKKREETREVQTLLRREGRRREIWRTSSSWQRSWRNCMLPTTWLIQLWMARDVEKLPFHVSSTIFQL